MPRQILGIHMRIRVVAVRDRRERHRHKGRRRSECTWRSCDSWQQQSTLFSSQPVSPLSRRGTMVARRKVNGRKGGPRGRLPEDALWHQFERARPRILGALLDAVSAALRHIGNVRVDRSPRMADFVKWITAAEPGLGWDDGAFLVAYRDNRRSVSDLAFDADSVAVRTGLFDSGRATRDRLHLRLRRGWEWRAGSYTQRAI